MTPPIDHAAAWQAMSDQERVEWIAREVMELKTITPAELVEHVTPYPQYVRYPKDSMPVIYLNDDDIGAIWNPLTDWNHWRSVEMKVMEDEKLFNRMMYRITGGTYATTFQYANSDLPTRAKALYLAFQSLSH